MFRVLDLELTMSKKTEEVMRKIDRGDFSADLSVAYCDQPHPIGQGQTISAPHMHAVCLENLEPFIVKENSRVLDVGG
jgi:protein-L-isoaspartate(D-aspartate) O-methyltransferase